MPIVAAVMAAAGRTDLGKSDLARRIEAAMSQAVLDAQAEGIHDPDLIRTRMLEARERVKAAVR